MNIPDRISVLMARSLCGEASPEDMAQLSVFAAANPEIREAMAALEQLFEKRMTEAALPVKQNIARRQKLDTIIQRTREADAQQCATDKPVRRQLSHWYKYAAVLLLLISGAFLLWRQNRQDAGVNSGIHTIAAAPGSRTRTMLPDGTKVWLNAGSTISYNGSFNAAEREVILKGEAFFDVAKNASLPFVVHIGKMNVTVLGTAFNVKLYEGDTTMETTLISGAVEVSEGTKYAKPIRLKPHQKLIMPLIIEPAKQEVPEPDNTATAVRKRSYHLLEVETAGEQALPETAWVYNRLVFKSESFEVLAGKLRRWYGIDILFDDEAAKELMFTGSFENETIEQAMIALQKVSPFIFKKYANEIHILSEK